jgi:hypothetical protein
MSALQSALAVALDSEGSRLAELLVHLQYDGPCSDHRRSGGQVDSAVLAPSARSARRFLTL